MKINRSIFRGYDIRGLVGIDLNSENVEVIGRAYGTYMKRLGITKALVGRDCRSTSEEYGDAIIRGFAWAGLDVVDIGMNLVGTFYWAQYFLGIKGGAFVTASHLPAQYNGFKLAYGFSETITGDKTAELWAMIDRDDFEQGETPGKVEKIDVREEYFVDVLKRLPIAKKFKVVVDPSCSTAGIIAPELLRRAGCEVIERNCVIDPTFPLGTPDPTEVVVAERIRKAVLETGADLGFSLDADGDRMGIIDEKGDVIWNDVLLEIFAIDVLNDHPGAKIMYNTLCSKAIKETIIKAGGVPFMWRTGNSFLKMKNQEVGAAFIGELSGHFFFSADFYNHDDGLYSIMRLLSYLSKTDKLLSDVVAELPKYISSPEVKLGCADDKKIELIEAVSKRLLVDFPNAEVINDERAGDGVRLELPDSMFVVRYSQNGPYITVKFEAQTIDKYNELKKYLKMLLLGYPGIDWDEGVNVEILE